ncbi:MAG: formylglycine-generating enzyme family protein [Planctomycetes bacterium]|nr:formylglycine-generating enzyme family protein [Planctomycetota bacterium]
MKPFLPCMTGLLLPTLLVAQDARYETFAAGCAGSMPPCHLSAVTQPWLGATLSVRLDNLPMSSAYMLLGTSNVTSPLGPLPLSTAGFGVPNCFLHVSPDAIVPVQGSDLRATFQMFVPVNSTLVGMRFYQQAMVPEFFGGAPFVMSDAAAVTIGSWAPGTPGTNLVLIAPGSFQMGSWLGAANEAPPHTVTISRPFWIGRGELTQAEYEDVMGVNPSHFRDRLRPVEMVSWDDAMEFCRRLNARETAARRVPAGYAYRLPTEAEWEYCCRAGTTSEWVVGGAGLQCADANHARCVNQTTRMGVFPANPWGLLDMHGNLYELCLDAWGSPSSNYTSAPAIDPIIRTGSQRVFRGGSWIETDHHCRSAKRDGDGPSGRFDFIGFRVVLAPVL